MPDISKAKAAKDRAYLDSNIRTSDGKIYTIENFIKKCIEDGYKPSAQLEQKIPPLSRRAAFRADNRESANHDWKIATCGLKTVYRMAHENGSSYDLTKTGYDFAITLTDPTETQKVKANEDLISLVKELKNMPEIKIPHNPESINFTDLQTISKYGKIAEEIAGIIEKSEYGNYTMTRPLRSLIFRKKLMDKKSALKIIEETVCF